MSIWFRFGIGDRVKVSIGSHGTLPLAFRVTFELSSKSFELRVCIVKACTSQHMSKYGSQVLTRHFWSWERTSHVRISVLLLIAKNGLNSISVQEVLQNGLWKPSWCASIVPRATFGPLSKDCTHDTTDFASIGPWMIVLNNTTLKWLVSNMEQGLCDTTLRCWVS